MFSLLLSVQLSLLHERKGAVEELIQQTAASAGAAATAALPPIDEAVKHDADPLKKPQLPCPRGLVACQSDGHHAQSLSRHCHGECLSVVALLLEQATECQKCARQRQWWAPASH